MPAPRRIKMVVEIDLDSVPGAFHTKEDAVTRVAMILVDRLGHYNPSVSYIPE